MTEKKVITFTIQEVSELTGLAPNTISAKCKAGEVPGVFRKGRRWYLTPESLQMLQEVKPRASHVRPGKRIQLELDTEPENAPETARNDAEDEAETHTALQDVIRKAAEELPDIISQPDLEFHDIDTVAETLIELAWKQIGSAAEMFIRAGYRLRVAEEEQEDERRKVS